MNIKVFNKTGRSLVFKGEEKLYGTFDGFFTSDTGKMYTYLDKVDRVSLIISSTDRKQYYEITKTDDIGKGFYKMIVAQDDGDITLYGIFYEYGNYDGGYFNVLEEITINYNDVIDLYSFDYSSNKPSTSYLTIYYKGQHLKVSRDSDGDGIYQGPNAGEYKGYYKFDDLSKECIQVPKPE